MNGARGCCLDSMLYQFLLNSLLDLVLNQFLDMISCQGIHYESRHCEQNQYSKMILCSSTLPQLDSLKVGRLYIWKKTRNRSSKHVIEGLILPPVRNSHAVVSHHYNSPICCKHVRYQRISPCKVNENLPPVPVCLQHIYKTRSVD